MKGITSTGFEYEISDELLDDYTVVESFCAIQRGEIGMFPVLIENVLGQDQLEALKNHVRGENKKVSTKALMKEFNDIVNGNQDTKNS